MEQSDISDRSVNQSVEEMHIPPNVSSPVTPRGLTLSPQLGEAVSLLDGDASGSPPPGAAMVTPYVYALGCLEPRFPCLAVEKEFAQAAGRAGTTGLTDRQTLHTVLSQRQNRYLVRQLCYVFTIEGLETYILQPRDPVDFELLVDAIRPAPHLTDVDVVIGVRGPLAPPELCNGLMVPMVAFDQIYSSDVDAFIQSIPRPEQIPAEQFAASAEELFMRIMQMADNAGTMDEHRALNYLAVRNKDLYERAAKQCGESAALTAVDMRPSRLSGVRRIVDVIFSYSHRQTGVIDKFFVRVDVTEEFPFVATPMSPYYDR